MIVNVSRETFGGLVRIGDMIAVANIVEHLRQVNNNREIKFYFKPGAINQDQHCQDFYNWLIENTDYFSIQEGNQDLPWTKVNIWDYRDISGDLVSIKNQLPMEKKIVIFPLFDANYNTWRNWPSQLLPSLVERFSGEEYKDYEKIICKKGHFSENCEYAGWRYSTNLIQNIHHIMTTEIFIGGDTGTTHFAFVLDRGPKDLLYYGSSRALVHTLPFYLIHGKGKMINYWLDFEGSSFKNQ